MVVRLLHVATESTVAKRIELYRTATFHIIEYLLCMPVDSLTSILSSVLYFFFILIFLVNLEFGDFKVVSMIPQMEQVQSNFNGLNTFGTTNISSRQG